jgi:hypothetical protein
MALIDAIPSKWRKSLKQQVFHISVCNINEAPFCKIESNEKNVKMIKASEIYWHLLSENQNRPTCITRWNQLLGIEKEEALWKSIFTLPLLSVKDVQIREFQYKIIHRYYPSQNKISKWDTSTSNICKLCKTAVADTMHTFSGCIIVKIFWNRLAQWLNHDANFPVSFTSDSILLGITPYKQSNHVLNHCLLYAKFFIHREKMADNKLSLPKFLHYYKRKLAIERESYILQDKLPVFNKVFGPVYNIL